MKSRSEYFWDEQNKDRELEICHLFHNHEIEPGSKFSVLGLDEKGEEAIHASIGVHTEDEQLQLSFEDNFSDDTQDDFVDRDLDDFQVLDLTLEWIFGDEKKIGNAHCLVMEDYLMITFAD